MRRVRTLGKSRKGDAFFIEEFAVWIVLALAAAVIFGLFFFAARDFVKETEDKATFEQGFGNLNAGMMLRTYLSMRADEPLDRLTDAERQALMAEANIDVPAVALTFQELLPVILADDACVSLLTKNEFSFMNRQKPEFGKLFRESASFPNAACKAFFERTTLYFRMNCQFDEFTFTATSDERSFSFGKGVGVYDSDPEEGIGVLVAASQAFPTETGIVTVAIDCLGFKVRP